MTDTKSTELAEMRSAASIINKYFEIPTPLLFSPSLSEKLGAEVWLKCEFSNPIGAFKLRGGLNLISALADKNCSHVVTASTGNHGQSIAYAARLFQIAATIFVPENANPDKADSIKRFGAEIRYVGENFDSCRSAAIEYSRELNARYIHPANERELLSGVGTAALEVLDEEGQLRDADVVIVPVGGGSGVCGWILARDELSSPTKIWATQSAQSSAAYESWMSGKLVTSPNLTTSEGLSTGDGYSLTQKIMGNGLDDFILVEDSEINDAVGIMLETQHVLLEPAGAAALAAAIKAKENIKSKRVVLVCSGSNISRAQLKNIIG